jgi:hypothetical protein
VDSFVVNQEGICGFKQQIIPRWIGHKIRLLFLVLILAVVRTMKNMIIGILGDLLAQKIIFADATLGLKVPILFLGNC